MIKNIFVGAISVEKCKSFYRHKQCTHPYTTSVE